MIGKLRRHLGALRAERRTLGWRTFVRKRGWRLVVAVFVVYLVRDVALYVLIPLAVAFGLSR